MDNKTVLSFLAMDLKRVALGIHRKSFRMADRFLLEALKRKEEVNMSELLPYMQTIIEHVGTLTHQDNIHRAEDALMYSTRIQNYILHKE